MKRIILAAAIMFPLTGLFSVLAGEQTTDADVVYKNGVGKAAG